MKKFYLINYILFILSLLGIIYALFFNPSSYWVYAIAIVCIPLAFLSFGFITMAKGKKDEEEEKIVEPFLGY